LKKLREKIQFRNFQRLGGHAALRQKAAKLLRRSSRYRVSRLSGDGRKNGLSAISSSLIGIPNRARNSRNSFSFNFFCWCVTFRPSPASPRP